MATLKKFKPQFAAGSNRHVAEHATAKLSTTAQPWLGNVRRLQALGEDWAAILRGMNYPQLAELDLIIYKEYDYDTEECLMVYCSAAVATRLRQITPIVFNALRARGWVLHEINCKVLAKTESGATNVYKPMGAEAVIQKTLNERLMGDRTLPSEALHIALNRLRK